MPMDDAIVLHLALSIAALVAHSYCIIEYFYHCVAITTVDSCRAYCEWEMTDNDHIKLTNVKYKCLKLMKFPFLSED